MRRSRTDVPWDPGYLELVSPEQVLLLDKLGPDAAGPTALLPVAITSPFRFLSAVSFDYVLMVSDPEGSRAGASSASWARSRRGGIF
jgi:hypothetical protein